MNDEKERLIQSIAARGYLKTQRVIDAFRKVPRENFVLPEHVKHAYLDTPLPIGQGATISQPLTVAYMTESLDVKDGQKILEIGAGSGYQAAILSVLNPNGKVYTIENIPELVEFAKKNLKDYKNVEVVLGDGSLGYKKASPYDRIIATCYCIEIPKPWVEQLKENGKLVTPVGGHFFQQLFLYEKKGGELVETNLNFPCAFVPLRGKFGAAP